MKSFACLGQGRALLLAAAVVVGAVCAAYSDNPAELVGEWVQIYDGDTLVLFKDGTGVMNSERITWKTEDTRFECSTSAGTMSYYGYTLSGYVLTLGNAGGMWVRKDKIEEYKKKKAEEAKKKAEETKMNAERMKKEAELKSEKISNYFTDSRNGQKYRSVKIGGKAWMAENLNYQTGNSWCYDNDNFNCKIYGRLYDWRTAKTACPAGWHLPSSKEWDNLLQAVGGKKFAPDDDGCDDGCSDMWKIAGKKLKSTSGWRDNGNGMDAYGFSALPSGYRVVSDVEAPFYTGVGESSGWWTTTVAGDGWSVLRSVYYGHDYVSDDVQLGVMGLSVRCVKDN